MREMKGLGSLAILLLVVVPILAPLQAEEISDQSSKFNPGDKVKIMMWRQQEMTGEYRIGVDGNLKMPLIGSVPASGLTVDGLTDTLIAYYSAYIKNPQIIVIPMFRVAILGCVKMPGSYWVSGSEKVTDLIAMAGGLQGKAVLEKTKITRGEQVIIVDAAEFLRTGRTFGDIGIQSGDIVMVPRSRWPNWTEWAVILSTVALGWSLYNTIK